MQFLLHLSNQWVRITCCCLHKSQLSIQLIYKYTHFFLSMLQLYNLSLLNLVLSRRLTKSILRTFNLKYVFLIQLLLKFCQALCILIFHLLDLFLHLQREFFHSFVFSQLCCCVTSISELCVQSFKLFLVILSQVRNVLTHHLILNNSRSINLLTLLL